MQCRKCGTEIADKAIVCYRCGTATTDPVRAPAELRRKRNPLFSFVGAALLLLLALYFAVRSLRVLDWSRHARRLPALPGWNACSVRML